MMSLKGVAHGEIHYVNIEEYKADGDKLHKLCRHSMLTITGI